MTSPMHVIGLIEKKLAVALILLGAVFVTVGICSYNIPWVYMEDDASIMNSDGTTSVQKLRFYAGLYQLKVCTPMDDVMGIEYSNYQSCTVNRPTGVLEDAGRVALGLTLAGITLAYFSVVYGAYAFIYSTFACTFTVGAIIFQSLCSIAFYIAALGHFHQQTKSEYDGEVEHFERSSGYILTWIGAGAQILAVLPLLKAFIAMWTSPHRAEANQACMETTCPIPACRPCPCSAKTRACESACTQSQARAAAPAASCFGNVQQLANFSLLLATNSVAGGAVHAPVSIQKEEAAPSEPALSSV
eukprot:TRINITY_DN901_c0_g1::TRINITY_DN901_c0_g1_i1::g.16107::m.16107 TRINITY_DN901_c0_g1::TRINITY_DN901_c0_g1_i1::g.16107  ORF type:complete len:324 (-),score=110.44,Claudin_2/PF13903.1/3.4e+02,Claudin_2/PF13903.1/0.032,STT3/PF02516.9/8.1,STT3/PF02516.9/2.8,DUF2648/PF10855.3/0.24 TRINITY_DN901_c0_g1_i1:258-1163(-)